MKKYRIKKGLLYTREGTWLKKKRNDIYLLGITDFTQANLGPIISFEPIHKSGFVNRGADLFLLECLKVLYPISAPFSCELVEINPKPVKYPSILNSSPFDIWLAKLRLIDEKHFSENEFMDTTEVKNFQEKPPEKASLVQNQAPDIELIDSNEFKKLVSENVQKWSEKVIRITDTTCCGVSVVVTNRKFIREEDEAIGYVLGIPLYIPPRINKKIREVIKKVKVEIKKGYFGDFFHFEFYPPTDITQ
ncbi:MAG: glycine cleavage system protein H [Candidatus Ranarchaeia archaeon]